MKGNPNIIDALNSLLADELTAINAYLAHYQMADNWGYARLKAIILDRANDERRHAEILTARILFLEGAPIVDTISKIQMGNAVPLQLSLDRALEEGAVTKYTEAVALAISVGDVATRLILERILAEEEEHIDEIESLQDQIAQMGLGQFLSTIVKA